MKTTMKLGKFVAAALLLFTGPSARAQGDNAEQERAIAKVEKLGGKVELDEHHAASEKMASVSALPVLTEQEQDRQRRHENTETTIKKRDRKDIV